MGSEKGGTKKQNNKLEQTQTDSNQLTEYAFYMRKYKLESRCYYSQRVPRDLSEKK